MTPSEDYAFLLRALTLKQVEVARKVGISPQHLSMVCSGGDKPSFDLAMRLLDLLRARYMELNGHTVPPEITEIVKAKLWPPAVKQIVKRYTKTGYTSQARRIYPRP